MVGVFIVIPSIIAILAVIMVSWEANELNKKRVR